MGATQDGVSRLAYARWEHRGRFHGFDREDWLAAERQDRFESNYRVIVADRLDDDAPRAVGSPGSRRCRFCSGASPRVSFAECVPIYPDELGRGGPLAFDQCDDCVSMFAEEIEPALLRFLGAIDRSSGIPVAAFKGLVKLALAVMPAADLDEHEETIDWVGNPDHDFDLSVLRDLACVVYRMPSRFPASWVTLARKMDDGDPWPSMLFFLGLGQVVLQIAVPLGRRDDEMETITFTPPDVLPSCPFGPGNDPASRLILPIVSEKRSSGIPAGEMAASHLLLTTA